MKVTVCELSDNERHFTDDWNKLKLHLDDYHPDLLLLPELPFSKWIAAEKKPCDECKMQSVEKHERWMTELEKLSAKQIVYSRPVIEEQKFYNSAFVFDIDSGHRKIHSKSFFPEEPHFWEQTWYDPEDEKSFNAFELNGIKIGVLLCTEMWFTEYARQYGKQGIDILLCPRATGIDSVNQWIRCGQTLSVISGAYCLSSNKSGKGDHAFQWGGNGWVAEPMSGELLGKTTDKRKFITKEIDITKSRNAKTEYPLYVRD
jgi:predicted amidohydrolase